MTAALEYALEAIAEGEERAPRLPAVLLTQARNGVPLDTILRRYFAGYTLLGDFLMQEAERASIDGEPDLQDLFRPIATLFDHLIAAVADEYTREGETRLPRPNSVVWSVSSACSPASCSTPQSSPMTSRDGTSAWSPLGRDRDEGRASSSGS